MFYLNCFEMITRWRPTRDEIIEKNFFLYPSQEFLSKIFSHLHISNIVLNYAFSNFYLVRTFEVDIKEQNVFKSKIFRVQKFGNFIRNRFQWFASDRLTTRRLKKIFNTWDRTKKKFQISDRSVPRPTKFLKISDRFGPGGPWIPARRSLRQLTAVELNKGLKTNRAMKNNFVAKILV